MLSVRRNKWWRHSILVASKVLVALLTIGMTLSVNVKVSHEESSLETNRLFKTRVEERTTLNNEKSVLSSHDTGRPPALMKDQISGKIMTVIKTRQQRQLKLVETNTSIMLSVRRNKWWRHSILVASKVLVALLTIGMTQENMSIMIK